MQLTHVHVAATTITRMGDFSYEADWLVTMSRDQYEAWRGGADLVVPIAGYRAAATTYVPLLGERLYATPEMFRRLVLDDGHAAYICASTPRRPSADGLLRRQERAILEAVTVLRLDPLKLPGGACGLSGPRNAICRQAHADDHHVFKNYGRVDDAFQRLLKAGKIA